MVCQRVSGYCISLIHSLKYCVESVLGLGLEGIKHYLLLVGLNLTLYVRGRDPSPSSLSFY